MCQQKSSDSFENNVTSKLFACNTHTHTHTHIYIYIYIYIGFGIEYPTKIEMPKNKTTYQFRSDILTSIRQLERMNIKIRWQKISIFLIKYVSTKKYCPNTHTQTHTQTHTHIYIVSANNPGERGSIPGRVIPKTQKWYLMPSCLMQHHKVWIKGKCSNPGKDVVPSPTHQYSSCWKGSFRVALDYCRPTYEVHTVSFHTFFSYGYFY